MACRLCCIYNYVAVQRVLPKQAVKDNRPKPLGLNNESPTENREQPYALGQSINPQTQPYYYSSSLLIAPPYPIHLNHKNMRGVSIFELFQGCI